MELGTALDHARNLFIYHAGQRLTTIRYFFVAYAIFVAAYVKTILDAHSETPELHIARIVISVIAFLLVLVFWFLDLRNREMVEIDEDAIKELENLAMENEDWSGLKKKLKYFNITSRHDEPKYEWRQYRKIINAMYIAILILTGVVIAYDIAIYTCV